MIGLCPDHGPHFYMPDPNPGDECPYCTLKLVIYKRTTLASARRAIEAAVALPSVDEILGDD